MGRILSEFLGTFLLISTLLLAPSRLAVAATLAACLWIFSHQPHGAFNPTATFVFALRRRLSWVWAGGLILVQLFAAVAAALFTALLVGHNPGRLAPDAPSPIPSAWLSSLSVEFLGTALLCLLLLAAFTSRRHAGSTLAPLLVGVGFFSLLEMFGNWSTFFNPAALLAWGLHDAFSALRADELGPALLGEAERLGRFLPWAILVGAFQILGALVGWGLFKVFYPEEKSA